MAKPPFTKGVDPFGPGGPHEGKRHVGVGGPTRSKLAQNRAEELGIDPFEILLHIAAGDFNKLYPDTHHAKPKLQYIDVEHRVKAAAEAVKYIYPALKSVEHTGADGNPLEVLMKLGESGLEQRIKELEQSLGMDAKLIQGTATPVPQVSSDEQEDPES